MGALGGLQEGAIVLTDGAGNVVGTSANPLRMSLGGPALINAVVAGADVTAASETSLLPAAAKLTLAPNFFKIGTQLRIRAAGKLSTAITTPGTFQFKVKLGPTANIAVFDGKAILPDTVAAHSNVGWRLDIDLLCLAVGASTSANLIGDGLFVSEALLGQATMPAANGVAYLPWATTPAAGTGFDSTVANVLDLTFTQVVTTGHMILQRYSVEQVA